MWWPWNLGWGSLSVIGNDTIRKLGYGFIFAFHSNYGFNLHHFGDKAIYWSKISIFSYPLHSTPRRNILPYNVWYEELEWWGYFMVKHEDMFSGVDRIPACDGRTDGRTDRHLVTHSPRYAYASRGKKKQCTRTLKQLRRPSVTGERRPTTVLQRRRFRVIFVAAIYKQIKKVKVKEQGKLNMRIIFAPQRYA